MLPHRVHEHRPPSLRSRVHACWSSVKRSRRALLSLAAMQLLLCVTGAQSFAPPIKALGEAEDHFAVVSTITWTPPNELLGWVGDMAYAEEDRLVFIRDPGISEEAAVAIMLDSEGNELGELSKPTDTLSWNPSTVTSVMGSSVLLNGVDSPIVKYTASGDFLETWDAPRLSKSSWPRRLSAAPDGTAFGAAGLSWDWSPVTRWLPDGRLAGEWTEGDPGRPGFGVLADLAAGADGDLFLLESRGHVYRTDKTGRVVGSLEPMWPSELVPSDDGHAEMKPEGIAVDHARRELLFFDDVQQGEAAHVFRTDEEGRYLSDVPLWRLRNERPRPGVSPAPRTDGFALNWHPRSRVIRGIDPGGGLGITQFRSDGSLAAVTRMRVVTPHSTFDSPEEWSRVRIGDSGDRPMLLSPTSGMLSRLGERKLEPWPRVVVPFAIDLSSSDEHGTFVRGWDALDGRVARYDTDGLRLWDVRCDCDLATGITHDEERVYLSDPAAGSIVAFSIDDGRSAGELALEGGTGTPIVDIAALGGGRLALLEPGGWVRVTNFVGSDLDVVGKGRFRVAIGDPLHLDAEDSTEGWRLRSASEAMAIAAGADTIAVLFADGVIEVWTTDGTFVDRWPVAPDGVTAPSDIAFSGSEEAITIVGEGGTIARYQKAPGGRGPVGDDGTVAAGSSPGPCAVESIAAANPSRLSPNDRTQVTISIEAACPPPSAGADVVIAWTPGNAFWYRHEFARAREAVDQLAWMLDVPGVRLEVAVPPTSGVGGEVLAPFGTPTETMIDRIGAYRRTDFERLWAWLDGGEDWSDFLRYAGERLEVDARPGVDRVIVLTGHLGDDSSLDFAETFLRDGGHLFVMEFPGVYPDWPLKPILARPSDSMHVAHAGDVGRIARRIIEPMIPLALRDPVLEVEHLDGTRYEIGSAEPAAIEEPGRIGWRLEPLETSPRVRYWILPRRTGTFPAFERATLHATQPDGKRVAFEIAPPFLSVEEATPMPEPSAAPTLSNKVFLPVSQRPD